jgi:co-chaperonin GroES (HSP10)
VLNVTEDQAAAAVSPTRDLLLLKLDPDPSPVISLRKYRGYVRRATVLDCGPGIYTDAGALVPLEVKRGDRVLIGPFVGIEVSLGGWEFLMAKESELFGVLEEENGTV